MGLSVHKKTFWILALLGVSIIWGTSFLIIKDILLHVSSANYLVLRFGMAFFLMIFLGYKKLRHPKKFFAKPGIILGLLLGCVYLLSSYGVAYTSASNATFISNLFMIFTPLFEVIFMKVHLEKKYLYGSIAALIGFVFISGFSTLEFNMGDGLLLLGAVFLSIHLLLTEQCTKKYETSSLVLTETATVFGIALLASLFTGGFALPTENFVYVEILYLALFSTIIAFEVIAISEKYMESTQTAIIISLQGIWSLLFALSLHTELLTVPKTIGVICMTLAVLIIEAPLRKRHV